MSTYKLHEVRAQILYTLRHRQTARFSELMKQTTLESDAFKFHIRALIEQNYIRKIEGLYSLTSLGKETANNLDEDTQHSLKQPKLSLLIVLRRHTVNGGHEYLVQQRLRQPFYGYWGCLSGPAQWGDDFITTAKKEIAKQCGITNVVCRIHSFYRQEDYSNTGGLLEDKLFVVIAAIAGKNMAITEWPYGRNEWVSMHSLTAKEKVFEASSAAIALVDSPPETPVAFTSGKTVYRPEDY